MENPIKHDSLTPFKRTVITAPPLAVEETLKQNIQYTFTPPELVEVVNSTLNQIVVTLAEQKHLSESKHLSEVNEINGQILTQLTAINKTLTQLTATDTLKREVLQKLNNKLEK